MRNLGRPSRSDFVQLVLWTSDLLLAGAYADIRISVRHASAGGGIV